MTGITQIITAAAHQYGVAPWVAEDIAQLESHDDPNAIGDHGTSFGLFQLHWGGQGTGYTAAQLKDPILNANIGISHMAAPYQKGVSMGLQGYGLLDYVATHSGHPGYGGPGHYPSYENALKNVYQSSGGTLPTNAPNQPAQLAADTTSNDFLTNIDNMTKIEGGFSLLNPVANAKPVFFRVCIVLIGLLCIIFGLFAIVQKVT